MRAPVCELIAAIARSGVITRIILCLLLLTVPAGQILIHSLTASGLWNWVGVSTADIGKDSHSIGILWNPIDNLVYASLALQNNLGIHLMSNLYATVPHPPVLFNLYFFGIGELSKALRIEPLAIMIITSFIAAPIVGYIVFTICQQQLKFGRATSLLAVTLVIFGSGPKWILLFINSAFAWIGMAYQLPVHPSSFWPGDLFPVEIFLVYPYHAAALGFQIGVLSVILKALRTDLTENPSSWIFLSAATLAALALIRPYEAFVFATLFPVTLLLSRLSRGERLLFRFRDYLIIVGLAGPSLGYILSISFLPGWSDWADSAFMYRRGWIEMARDAGYFSVFWILAIIGVLRAFREKRLDMLFLCLWTFSTMLLLIGFGASVDKLLCGAVIAYGILGAFGLEGLLRHLAVHLVKYTQPGQKIFCGLAATAAALFMSGTSLHTYRMALDHGLPRVDTEILARLLIDPIPVVLTDCSTASVLPGLAGARVYSGHWGLTPGFEGRCNELRFAGFEEQLSPAIKFSETRLRDIVAKTKPDFVLIRRGTPAEQWLLDHRTAVSASMIGRRWSLLIVRR